MPTTVNKVAVATTSALAAEAAAEIAECGGNAVDCAIAAAMFSINTEPGVCALAGSAYVTIWPPGRDPVTIDGNVAIPGIGVLPERNPTAEVIQMEYGGGIETMVGATSVAVPGTLAALHLASEQFGRLAWHELLRPTIRAARNGFPLSHAVIVEDFPDGANRLNQIRKLVGFNILLGLATAIVATAGRYLS